MAAVRGFRHRRVLGGAPSTAPMQRNVGGADRTARIVLGFVLAVVSMATVAFGGGLGPDLQLVVAALALLLAAVFLATAGAQTCPVNSLVGRDTYRDKSRL